MLEHPVTSMADDRSSFPNSKSSLSMESPAQENKSNVDISQGDVDSKKITVSFKVPGGLPIHPFTKSGTRKDNPLVGLVVVKAKSETDNVTISSTDSPKEIDTSGTKQDLTLETDNEKKAKISGLALAEELKNSQVTIPYKEPTWSGLCTEEYQFEVIKNGSIIDTIDLTKKPFYVFGRLPSCDVTMEHPSLSRYHAVLQYSSTDTDSEQRKKGWYLYDLDSTHGTWINKVKVKPQVYNRIRVGHVVKLGGSSRLHILQGPGDDQDAESELSITELKEQRERHRREAEVIHQAELIEEENRLQKEKKRLEDKGCCWGINEDAEDEDEDNPFMPAGTKPENEHLYVEDPKKALKGYFEREGYDLPEYQFADSGSGKHKCMVELPIDGPSGEPVIAEVVISGKRKDAVVACALEACRLLDKHGELRKSKHESHKRKGRNWEDDDFYDSDEDTFLDRTGTIEKKRVQRMKRAGKIEDKSETYDSLLARHTAVMAEIGEIEVKLVKAKEDAATFDKEEVDALDAYMSAIKSGVMDTRTKMKLKCQLIELKQQEQKLRRLVNVAKPASLPQLRKVELSTSIPVACASLPSVGKIHKGPKKPVQLVKKTSAKAADSGEEVEEDDDDDDDDNDDDDKDHNADIAVTSSDSQQSETMDITSSGADSKVTSTSSKVKCQALPSSIQSAECSSSPRVKGPALPTSRQSAECSSTPRVKGPAFPTISQSAECSSSTRVKGPALPTTGQSADSSSSSLFKSPAVSSSTASTASDPSEVSSSKVSGPAMPSSSDAVGSDSTDVVERAQKSDSVRKARKRSSLDKAKEKGKKTKAANSEEGGDYDESDPNYAVWLPPTGQTGDGKTYLNDKYGY